MNTRTGTSAGVGAAAGADWVYWETVLVEVTEGKQKIHKTTESQHNHRGDAAVMTRWDEATPSHTNTQMGGVLL